MFGENRFSLQVLPGFQICFKIELVVLYLPGFNSQDALPWLQCSFGTCPPADRWGNLQKGIPPRRCKPGTHSSLTELRAADTPGQPSAYPNKKGSKKRWIPSWDWQFFHRPNCGTCFALKQQFTYSKSRYSLWVERSVSCSSEQLKTMCRRLRCCSTQSSWEDSLGASLKILGSWKIYE